MPGSASYAILFLGTFLEALVVVCAIKRKILRKYFVLNLYMVVCLLVSWGRHYTIAHYGLGSLNYRYFYFYTDALLTIVLYFSLISLYLSVFEEMKVGRYLRLGAVALLADTRSAALQRALVLVIVVFYASALGRTWEVTGITRRG